MHLTETCPMIFQDKEEKTEAKGDRKTSLPRRQTSTSSSSTSDNKTPATSPSPPGNQNKSCFPH